MRQKQYREIGVAGWHDCSDSWFNYCNGSAIHDTRIINREPIKPNNFQDQQSESQSEWLGKS